MLRPKYLLLQYESDNGMEAHKEISIMNSVTKTWIPFRPITKGEETQFIKYEDKISIIPPKSFRYFYNYKSYYIICTARNYTIKYKNEKVEVRIPPILMGFHKGSYVIYAYKNDNLYKLNFPNVNVDTICWGNVNIEPMTKKNIHDYPNYLYKLFLDSGFNADYLSGQRKVVLFHHNLEHKEYKFTKKDFVCRFTELKL